MTESDLQKKIQQLCLRIASGQNPEDNKLEIKSQWYSLKNKENKNDTRAQNEFLKDLVALANTTGLDGYLVIGIDSQGELKDSPFSSSGLKDQTDLRNLVIKSVDTPVDFTMCEISIPHSGTTIIVSVLEVPFSNDRPHVIGRYVTPSGFEIQNYIPIRKLTGVFAASRNDLELMYFERAHHSLEYALELSSHKPKFFVSSSNEGLTIEFQLVFHNTGEKTIAIVEAEIEILPDQRLGIEEPCKTRLDWYKGDITKGYHYSFSLHPLVIESSKLQNVSVAFSPRFPNDITTKISNHTSLRFLVRAIDTNEKEYLSKILQRSP